MARGHYDWPPAPGHTTDSAAERQRAIGKILDAEIGRFVAGLRDRGLADDSIVVVLGDHGLRFTMEFEALDQTPAYGDLTFNVPFLLYAPAIFPSRVELTHVHVARRPRADPARQSHFFLHYDVTNRVTVRNAGSSAKTDLTDGDRRWGLTAEDVRRMLTEFGRHTEEVGAFFLRRVTSR